MDQLDLLEQINHDIGRSEAKRDALRIVKRHLDYYSEELHKKERQIAEGEKAFEWSTYYKQDNPALMKLKAVVTALDNIHKEIFKL